MEFRGIDVSKHNGVIEWEKVKNSGIEFAILRAGFGREDPKQIDAQFERNYSECKRLGIPVGAYHYSYAKNSGEARSELDFFLKIVKGKQFEYPLCYDVEDDQILGCSRKTLTDNVIEFCGGLEKAGYYSAVYCNVDWLNNRLDCEFLERFDLWLADWRQKPDTRAKRGIWQYYDKGHIVGIDGNVDLDIAYKNYPEIIKSRGLNGFGGMDKKYRVTAEKTNIDFTEAGVLATKLRDLNMTVEKTEL